VCQSKISQLEKHLSKDASIYQLQTWVCSWTKAMKGCHGFHTSHQQQRKLPELRLHVNTKQLCSQLVPARQARPGAKHGALASCHNGTQPQYLLWCHPCCNTVHNRPYESISCTRGIRYGTWRQTCCCCNKDAR
jgi:hypothetical protein